MCALYYRVLVVDDCVVWYVGVCGRIVCIEVVYRSRALCVCTMLLCVLVVECVVVCIVGMR